MSEYLCHKTGLVTRLIKTSVVLVALCFSSMFFSVAHASSHTQNNKQELNDEIFEIAELKTKAQDGDSKSQFLLAKHYVMAKEGERDDAQAYYWMKQSADQGYDRAMAGMGWLYSVGRGVKQDSKAAFSWFLKASEKGNALAQRMIARAYEKGLGVHRDHEEAHHWYEKAANSGDEQAKKRLLNWK